MPVITPANNYVLGIHKQSAEGTVGTVADYSVPVYGERPEPTYDVGQIAVTDASSVAADTYKKPSSWSLANATFPAFDNALGTFIVGLYGTDTASGSAPSKLHTFTGLGAAQPWMSFYGRWPGAGTKYHTFGKGIVTGLTFGSTDAGGPLEVGISAMGQTVTDEASTVTTAATLADGYFGLQVAGSYIKFDYDTPNVAPSVALTNVTDLKIELSRNASAVPTADSATVSNISQGLLTPSMSFTMLWTDWQAFNANYFGAVAGTTLSGTQVTGAIEILWKHSVSATSTLKIYIPAMVYDAKMPQPNPDGSPMTVPVTGRVQKPSSGEHVQVFLTNNVTPAY
jgi:hypothetical protein